MYDLYWYMEYIVINEGKKENDKWHNVYLGENEIRCYRIVDGKKYRYNYNFHHDTKRMLENINKKTDIICSNVYFRFLPLNVQYLITNLYEISDELCISSILMFNKKSTDDLFDYKQKYEKFFNCIKKIKKIIKFDLDIEYDSMPEFEESKYKEEISKLRKECGNNHNCRFYMKGEKF